MAKKMLLRPTFMEDAMLMNLEAKLNKKLKVKRVIIKKEDFHKFIQANYKIKTQKISHHLISKIQKATEREAKNQGLWMLNGPS
jgi:hypothetical protein